MTGPTPAVQVRPLRRDELLASARAHSRHLPHGLFPRLGAEFVARWHGDHVRSPYGIALVAEVDGQPAGFLVGSTDQAALVGWILAEDRRALVALGVRGLLTRPAVLLHFTRTRALRYARALARTARRRARGHTAGGASRADAAAPPRSVEPVAVVEGLVVLPWARGWGAGEALVEAFCALARSAGTRRAELVTKADPRGASGFYERLGWRRLDEHRDRDGDLVVRLGLPLSTTVTLPDTDAARGGAGVPGATASLTA